MVDAIKVEMTRDQLKHQIMVNELFKKSCPQAERKLTDEALNDFKHANQMLELKKINAKSDLLFLKNLAAYLEAHDHDLKCRVLDSYSLNVEIRNYWNGIGDAIDFYIIHSTGSEFIILSDDGYLVDEEQMHTPGVRYSQVIRSMAYSDINQYGEEIDMMASAKHGKAFQAVEKFKQFLIESFSAYYDKVE